MGRFLGVVALTAILALQGAEAAAQGGPPPGVTLTLRIAGGRHDFRPGEIIPLELEFSTSIPQRFFVDTATYDRSGRLTIDRYFVEPNELVMDPLLDYFAASRGFVGGGVRGISAIDAPVRIALQLNEWFRFERPGLYTLSVISNRVTDGSPSGSRRAAVVPVASNTVSFNVIPRESQWEIDEIARALQIINSHAPEWERREGCRILRFLASAAAVDEMIKRYDDGQWDCAFDYMIGMFEAPDRARTVRQMEIALRSNPPPISQTFIQTLACLSVYLQHQEFRLAQTRDRKGAAAQSGELSRHDDLIHAAESRYTAIAAIRDPTPTFLQLAPERQLQLLRDDWPLVNQSAMIPILNTLAGATPAPAPTVADVALRRLYELAPEQARALILRNIEAPPPAATMATLGLLPDEQLPFLDDTLLSNVESAGVNGAESIHSELLERYASPQIASRVHAYVDSRIGGMACRQQAALLAYFLRVGDTMAQALLERAAASPYTGCSRTLLADIARYRR